MGKGRNKLTKEEREERDEFLKDREEQQNASSLGSLRDVKIDLKCKNETQKDLTKKINDNEITVCTGPAGTGKTYIACAQALKLLKDPSNNFNNITIVKSVATLEDEDIGYLKGSESEKMEPFLQSFISNFEKIADKNIIKKLREDEIIKNIPIAFVRGMNFDQCICLIDESQNITTPNMRRLITRIGYDSKMIFMGDIKQKDIKKDSAIDFMRRERKQFEEIEGFGFCEFDNEHIVRNPIIEKIEGTFDEILYGE